MPFPRIFSLINKNSYDYDYVGNFIAMHSDALIRLWFSHLNILFNQFQISMFDSFYFLIPINTK